MMSQMDIALGELGFSPLSQRTELASPRVLSAALALPFASEIMVAPIDPTLSDTAAFCMRYRAPLERTANCVILEGKRDGERSRSACVVLASTKADINDVARRALGMRKVSFANAALAVEESGMEYGAITPIGLPLDWRILVDEAVTRAPYVILGSGIRSSKIAVPGGRLGELPNVTVVTGLGLDRSIERCEP